MNTSMKIHVSNENLKENFYNIIVKKREKSLAILKEICYIIDLKSLIHDTDLLTISIYFKNKISFDILMERGININYSIINMIENKGMRPILWALNTNNDYFINKLLERDELNLFFITEYNINIITHLCEIIEDINVFEKILNKMKEISFERTEKYILDMPILFIEYCIKCYINNNNKELLFNKLRILFNYSDNIVNKMSLKYFLEDYILKYNLKHIMIELYNFLKGTLINVLVVCPIITSTLSNSLELIKIFHNEGYSLNEYNKLLLTPLNIALKNNNIEIINYLIENNVDICVGDKYYDNLYYSIIYDNLDIFKYISKYFNIFKEYDNYNTLLNIPKYYRPIHIAFAHKSLNIILYLSGCGEDFIYNGNCLLTPLDVGIANNMTTLDINTLTIEYKSLLTLFKKDKYKYFCNGECCICLDNMYNKDMIKLNCGHIFHKKCLLLNIKNSNKCPYCRSDIIIDYYIYNNLGIVKNKNTHKLLHIKNKLKRRKSFSSLYDKNYKKDIIYRDDTNIDSLYIELLDNDYYDKWDKKFELLKEELENNDKERKIKIIKNILMKSKYINKINKRIKKYTTPSPTPIKKKRIYKTEIMKLKEIYNNMEDNIAYPRKTRNKKVERYGF